MRNCDETSGLWGLQYGGILSNALKPFTNSVPIELWHAFRNDGKIKGASILKTFLLQELHTFNLLETGNLDMYVKLIRVRLWVMNVHVQH